MAFQEAFNILAISGPTSPFVSCLQAIYTRKATLGFQKQFV
jgi:hypothetical protein